MWNTHISQQELGHKTSPREIRLGRTGGEVGFTSSGLWAGRGCGFPSVGPGENPQALDRCSAAGGQGEGQPRR